MNCLYCGEKLGLFARRFCNAKHQELWRKRESDLAIQRLMDPFGTGGSPAIKQPLPKRSADASAGNTSLIVRGEKAAPPEPREPAENRPADRSDLKSDLKEAAKEPVAPSGNVAGERTAPPLAGFISPAELSAVQRLPVFTRRPEPGKCSGAAAVSLDPRFIDQILARRAFEDRGVETGFCMLPCIPPIHGCEPERHVGRLFVESPDGKLSCTLPLPARKPDFQACKLPTTALQAPAFAPHPKESEPRVYGISGAVRDAQPTAMSRRAVERKPVVVTYPELVQGSLPHVAGPQPQAAGYSETPRTLGAAIGRAKPAPPNSVFQVLPVLQKAPVVPAGAATAPCVDLLDRMLLGTALSNDPRKLQFQACKLPVAAPQTPAFAPHPKEAEPRAYAVSGARPGVLPVAMACRAVERKLLVARYAEAVQAASLPLIADPQPQAHDSQAPRALGALLGRLKPAPIAMARRAVEHKPMMGRYPETGVAGYPQTAQASSPPTADPQPQAHDSQAPRALGALLGRLKPAPIVMARRAVQRQLAVARYPETVPAGLLHVDRSQPQATRRVTAPLALGVAIGRVGPAVPNSTFQALPILQTGPAWTVSAAAQCADLPDRKRLCTALPIEPRTLDLQACELPGTALSGAVYAPPPKESEPTVYSASRPVSLVRPMALPRRAPERQSVAARYPECVQSGLPHRAGPQPQATRYAKALRAPAAAIGRVRQALAKSAFQALPILNHAPDVPASGATTPCVILPHRKLLCTAFRVEPRRLDSHAWKLPGSAFRTPVFAPHLRESDPRLHAVSDAAYDVRPIALSRRETELRSAVAKYPEIVQASLPRGGGPQPQAAGYSTAQHALRAAIGRARPELPNSAFQGLPTWQRAAAAPARAVAQCADLPDRKLLCVEPRIEARKLDSHAWKLPIAALQTSAFAPHPKESESRRYEGSGAAYGMRPTVLARRPAARKRAVAAYPEMVPVHSPHVVVPRQQATRGIKMPRPLGAAAIRRVRPALPNSVFRVLPAGYNAPVAPMRAVTATPQATADIAIHTHRRHLQFADVTSIWHRPGGLPVTDISSRQPEFELGDLDYTIGCPSRPGPSRNSRPRFVPWSKSPSEYIQASFLNLQSSVKPGGANVTAGMARIAAWAQAKQSRDPSAPILQLPRRMSLPIQRLPAETRRHSTTAEGEWSVVGVSVLPEHPQPSPAESRDAVELTLASVEALSQLGKATAASSGLKWVPLKVPWIPLP